MADISLTASMRSNLLSLQSTQSLMDMTQERLATGKKVNSAIDNPSSYYTAQSLNNRADDLSALLDSMGQGVQTIKAANEAIETITSFAEQAKAIANSARDVASNYDKYALTSDDITSPVTGTIMVDAREDLSKFDLKIKNGENSGGAKSFTVYTSDGKAHTIKTLEKSDSTNYHDIANDLIVKLQGIGLNAEVTADTSDGGGVATITVSSTDGSAISWKNDGTSGLAESTGSVKEVTLDASSGANSATIAAAINKAGAGVTAETEGKRVALTAKNMEFRVFSDGSAANKKALDTLGLEGTKKAGDASVITEERVDYAEQFNEILSQIDSLAKDASYKGINLLQENDLTVIFNEDRTSKIEVKGVDGSSKGLGMSVVTNNWQKDADIDASISQIEGAISKLRTMASDFGNNYSIVQTREEFTDNLINVLTEGADNLTLADMNEESANMLALQTRQQLAINSLSLASQASQSVLQLF